MSRAKKFSFSLVTFVLVLLIAEMICAVALRIKQGSWIYTQAKNENSFLFEPDSALVGVPRKNVSVTIKGIHYQHNAQGFRGKEIEKTKTKKRVLCIGGSTTYGIGVSNNETWPYYLDSLLQPNYEVLNLGIPGHTTVEHKKLLPEAIKKYAPDIVILHCGLNDLRCMHVTDLGDDYSHFHQLSLHATLGFCEQDRLPRIALVHVVYILLQKAGLTTPCLFRSQPLAGKLSDAVDERVVKTFSGNLETMIQQCTENRISVYLLPQVLSEDAVTEENLKWWIPYLTKRGIFNALDATNGVMRNRSDLNQSFFILPSLIETENITWSKTDFYDASHLNAEGNRKLAALVKTKLAAAGSSESL